MFQVEECSWLEYNLLWHVYNHSVCRIYGYTFRGCMLYFFLFSAIQLRADDILDYTIYIEREEQPPICQIYI